MEPLASYLRPKSIKDIVGQKQLLDKNGVIQRMVQAKFTSNLIFYGPPGVGKTSFANALANDLGKKVYNFNAGIDKKEKLDKILKESSVEDPAIIVIDEVHRMNQQKQDILLEYMEKGQVIVYFTTTENPYFVINPAIRSRSTILELNPISTDDIFDFLKEKIKNKEISLDIEDEPLMLLAEMSSGDLRVAINKIELLTKLYQNTKIDISIIKKIFDNRGNQMGSKYGDTFHDLKSALQKSIRGSDVDASLYYFARLLELGEYEALMRRMIVMSYEDIGLANPAVPQHVVTATQAFRQLGMPEGLLPLGLAICEMALSEKSNSSALASWAAQADVKKGKVYDMPSYLKDAHYASASKLNRGVGYKYPHDYPNAYVKQQYLPDQLKDRKYYNPKTTSAYERKVNALYEQFKNPVKK
ncbi:replication-associated recombination protein A [Mesoplasma lactucae]|nr:replication-associated recombination protein A [Mesoplasma lactucae]ATZ20204.1 recombination factor protein RarA [Mesoplasma lactucae ATCC 49193]MCL8216953.1 putative AAA domain-containing protein [Mesoplasma lactucae ATCC 49193]